MFRFALIFNSRGHASSLSLFLCAGYHVAGVYDGGSQKMSLYIDGKLSASSTEQSCGIHYPDAGYKTKLAIGGYVDQNEKNMLNANIHSVNINNYAMTAAQIGALQPIRKPGLPTLPLPPCSKITCTGTETKGYEADDSDMYKESSCSMPVRPGHYNNGSGLAACPEGTAAGAEFGANLHYVDLNDPIAPEVQEYSGFAVLPKLDTFSSGSLKFDGKDDYVALKPQELGGAMSIEVFFRSSSFSLKPPVLDFLPPLSGGSARVESTDKTFAFGAANTVDIDVTKTAGFPDPGLKTVKAWDLGATANVDSSIVKGGAHREPILHTQLLDPVAGFEQWLANVTSTLRRSLRDRSRRRYGAWHVFKSEWFISEWFISTSHPSLPHRAWRICAPCSYR